MGRALREGPAARRLSRSWRWGGLGLVVLCLTVYVPGLFVIPPVDRDESRFAMASWQMYTSGDWVVPRVQERARLNKPPLIYWMQAGAWAVLGSEEWKDGGIWVFRLPSVLAAITTVLLTWRLGLRMFDPRAALLGAALLAVCPMVVWDAHQARADQVLLTTVVAAQFALWVVWKGEGIKGSRDQGIKAKKGGPSLSIAPALRGFVTPLCFWLAIGAGIMVKGPITPMIAGLTCLMLCIVSRRWGWLWRLQPLVGLVVVTAMVGPWVYLVGERVGWSDYLKIVYDETIGRSAGAKEGHWGPPGYHTLLLGVLFWPGSLLTAMAIARAFRRGLAKQNSGTGVPPVRSWQRAVHWFGVGPARPAELFCLAWIVPSWIVFELVSTKLPHYTMPMYPAIALLSARMLMKVQSRRSYSTRSNVDEDAVIEYLRRGNPRCPRCRYSLVAQPSARCPECGAVVALRRVTLFNRKRLVDSAGPDLGQEYGQFLWFMVGFAVMLLPSVMAAGIQVLFVFEASMLGAQRGTGGELVPLLALFTVLAAVCTICSLIVSRRLLRDRLVVSATLASLLGLALSYFLFLQGTLPSARYIWISPRILAAIARMDPSGQLPVGDMSYREDSLIFLSRGRVERLANHDEATAWIKAHPSSILIAESVPLELVLGAAGDYDGVSWRTIARDSVEGFDYSTGRSDSLDIVELSP